jgi:hypothetical protein
MTEAVGISGVDSAPYQSAALVTSYITAPSTSGHTFVYGWQPSGSPVAPAAIDFSTYLAANLVYSGFRYSTSTNAYYALGVSTSDATDTIDYNYASGVSGNDTFLYSSGSFAYGTHGVTGTNPVLTGTPHDGAVLRKQFERAQLHGDRYRGRRSDRDGRVCLWVHGGQQHEHSRCPFSHLALQRQRAHYRHSFQFDNAWLRGRRRRFHGLDPERFHFQRRNEQLIPEAISP